ncbi:hypothetical protein [Streptomyces naphthomycinicus]|uniref:hypothetical protein n=1 Tax=Streptomyces naphthomycinicus TaxID=2872625 RepID=UPI001CEDC31E|nr:hypothetical protein [Streptomyces sp. TML10]
MNRRTRVGGLTFDIDANGRRAQGPRPAGSCGWRTVREAGEGSAEYSTGWHVDSSINVHIIPRTWL